MPDTIDSDADASALDQSAVIALGDLVGGNQDALRAVVAAFLDDAPGQIEQLRSGVEQGDATFVRRVAHTLKGNGATFGALGLAQRCRELEEAAREGSLEDGAAMIAKVERAWAEVRPAIERLGAGAGR